MSETDNSLGTVDGNLVDELGKIKITDINPTVIKVSDIAVDDEDCDEDGDDEVEEATGADASKKKKKKKKKPKKKKTGASESAAPTEPKCLIPSLLPHSRNVGGFTDYYIALGQTNPPTIPVADLFPSGDFPVGQELPHNKTKYPDPGSSYMRMTEAEKRDNERIMKVDLYDKVRII